MALFLDTSSLPAMSSPTLVLSLGQLASLPFYRQRMGDTAGQAKLPPSQEISLERGANPLDSRPAPCSLRQRNLEERARGEEETSSVA